MPARLAPQRQQGGRLIRGLVLGRPHGGSRAAAGPRGWPASPYRRGGREARRGPWRRGQLCPTYLSHCSAGKATTSPCPCAVSGFLLCQVTQCRWADGSHRRTAAAASPPARPREQSEGHRLPSLCPAPPGRHRLFPAFGQPFSGAVPQVSRMKTRGVSGESSPFCLPPAARSPSLRPHGY